MTVRDGQVKGVVATGLGLEEEDAALLSWTTKVKSEMVRREIMVIAGFAVCYEGHVDGTTSC